MGDPSAQDVMATLESRLDDDVRSFDLRVHEAPADVRPEQWRKEILEALYDSLRLSIPETVRHTRDPDAIREAVSSFKQAPVLIRCWVRTDLRADGEMVGPDTDVRPGDGSLTDRARSLVAARLIEEMSNKAS